MINLVTGSALCFLQLLLLAVMCLGPSTIQAQTYPTQSIKLISPIPSGGAPDLIARIIAAKLSELTQQAVVVENRVGSNGMIAADYVAKSTADAHTLLVGMDSIFTINPYLYTKSSLDVNRELVPVATLGSNQCQFAGQVFYRVHRMGQTCKSTPRVRLCWQWKPAPFDHGTFKVQGRC